MVHRLGNGLPSTLTPVRIKAVLDLANSHERILREALDADCTPAWTATESDGDLYERLRVLIATVQGRTAYEKARSDFENQKAKLVGRADFFRRLLKDCLKEASSTSRPTDDGSDFERDPIQSLVEAGAWARVAEALWAESLIFGDAEHLLDALTKYPEVFPYLEEVQAGLTQQESDEFEFALEEEGEASELVSRVRRLGESLDSDRLNERELQVLSFDSWRLAEIAKARALRKRVRSSLIIQVTNWEEKFAEEHRNADAIVNALKALTRRIEHGTADQNAVTNVLDVAERLLFIEKRCRETQEKQEQALNDADFDAARSFIDALESLNAQRVDCRLAFDTLLSEPRSDHSPTQTPDTEHSTAVPEPKTNVPEARPGDSGAPLVEAVPGTDDLNQESQDPNKELASASDDKATDGEPTTSRVGTGDERASEVTEPPDNSEAKPAQHTEDAIKTAMDDSRLGIAYHLARSLPDATLSADTIKLVACNYAADARTSRGTELSNLAEALLNQARPPHASISELRDEAVLATCASLAPALEAPGGLVAQLISSFDQHLADLPSLRELAKTAAEVSRTGVDLPFALLREDDTVDKWRDRESDLRTETKSWLATEYQATIRFQAATRVWRRMLEEWEQGERSSLGHMFTLLESPAGQINTQSISEIAEYWRIYGEREIDRVDRENRRRPPTKKIEGAARLDLRRKVDQAVALAHRWLSLIKERPDKRSPFPSEQAKLLRKAVHNHAEHALAEIDASAAAFGGRSKDLLRRYTELFTATDIEGETNTLSMTDILNGELLGYPDIAFDATGTAVTSALEPTVLCTLLQRGDPDFVAGAIERARRGDFSAAEFALDFAERTGRVDDRESDLSRAKIEEHRSSAQQNLEHRIEETKDRLDAAYAAGALTLATYEGLRGETPLADFSLSDEFVKLNGILEKINAEIVDAQEGRRDALRRSLENLDRLSSDDKRRVESAIDNGSYQIAEDFIERIERNEELPDPETVTSLPFDQFFPHFVDSYSVSSHRGGGIGEIRSLIEKRATADIVDASQLSEDARRDGIELLDAWLGLRDNRTSLASVRTFMKAIGFDDAKVKGSNDSTQAGEKLWLLETGPVADRRIARLPDFGSRADGRYRIFAIRGRATEEAIIREAAKRDTARNSPSIVLFLGVLDTDARRALARDFSSGNYHPTIVLDEALVAFLAAQPHSRLGAFFDCASGFAYSQPFDPDAAEVPPEMFFGRADARQAVLAMSGDTTHFLYGGRRLGKTALLASIAREYRTAQGDKPRELVLLINLKGSGIGENRQTEELWSVFAKHLVEHGVLQPQTIRPESIERGVRQWLEEHPGRRILLLVDEADAFLDAERGPKQGYRVLEQIKRLMEQTERRFKVVFAGLHNVQRAARDPNTPFAHLGDAIRIGPMLPETDHEEIQNLIRSPLEALGYRFTSNDSIIRIAAETNYYPALAQQFCKELLKTLREEESTSSDQGPPYAIHPDTVDRVFNARETRDRIRNLFSWTIQLDPRYEFLTYLIAQKSFDSQDARPQAVSIAEIRDSALSEWPEGFISDSSFWMFELILEEMVGLGILREASDKYYAIRTRNLRMLLGNDDEIERRFVDAKSKRPPAIFDPAQFRSTLEDDTPSSLTADQERRLLSGGRVLGIIMGTRLAGLDRIGDSLLQARNEREENLNVEQVRPGTLRRTLDRLSRSRKAGTHIVLVDARGAWDAEMVRQAAEFVGEHDSRNRLIRPVFLCGPEEAWMVREKPIRQHERVECREIWLSPCAFEFTRNWLAHRESLAYSSMENSVPRVDHPWPAVVGVAAQDKSLVSIDEAADATLNRDGIHNCISDILISETAKTALRLMSTFPDESMTVDFLADLSQDEGISMSPEEVAYIIEWADLLGVVHRDGTGYRLDSTYARGLGRIFTE